MICIEREALPEWKTRENSTTRAHPAFIDTLHVELLSRNLINAPGPRLQLSL